MVSEDEDGKVLKEGREGETDMVSPPHTRSGVRFGQVPLGGLYPLWEVPVLTAGGPLQTTWVHNLFPASDLYNWKQNLPEYRSYQHATTEHFSHIFITHHPTWADCQTLLGALLTAEERCIVLAKAKEKAEEK